MGTFCMFICIAKSVSYILRATYGKKRRNSTHFVLEKGVVPRIKHVFKEVFKMSQS